MLKISKRRWREELQRLGDNARDRRDFIAAAELYENALAFGRESAGLVMAAGHMRKEGKDFAQAEKHYLRVLELTPDSPEIHMQLGHFYKTTGRYREAQKHYSLALANGYPNLDEVSRELHHVYNSEGLARENDRTACKEDAGYEGLVSPNGLFVIAGQLLGDLAAPDSDSALRSKLGALRRAV